MEENPYAWSGARLEPSFERAPVQSCWRIGKDELFVSRYSDLPHRCVKCNAPARLPAKRRSFYWHSSGWYALILVSLIFYAIAAMIVRKKAEVSPGLCGAHSRQRGNRIWAAFGALLAGCALAWFAALYEQPWLAFASFFGGLVASIAIAMLARIIYPVYIDERGARFKGCGPAFLASLDAARPY